MITLNQPMFDWVTLTTYEEGALFGMRHSLTKDVPIAALKPERRLQYKGVAAGSHFWGMAEQRGVRHYMMQSSGSAAQETFLRYIENFGPYDFNVTRCDLQVTIDLPKQYDSRAVYDSLVLWDGKGRSRKVSIVQSGDGNDTIYIGARASDRFTRLYVKPLHAGKALRFEVEYKGDHAHHVWNSCARDASKMGEVLRYELENTPFHQHPAHKLFLRVVSGDATSPTPKRVQSESNTIQWFLSSVEPSLRRMALDHENGAFVRQMLERWYNEIVVGKA